MSDPGKYRTKEEVEQMMLQDPLIQFGKRLTEQERVSASDLEAMEAEIQAIVEECVRYADESPVPPPEALYEDVYVRSPYIHMKTAEKDPAWRASVREDRVPAALPPWTPAAPPAPAARPAEAAAPAGKAK
jgi:hypothetical protein